MIRFLRWLWFGDGHKHIYEFEKTINVHEYDEYTGKPYDLPTYRKRVYYCKICGKPKTYEV